MLQSIKSKCRVQTGRDKRIRHGMRWIIWGGSEVLVCGEVLTEKQRGRLMDTITLAVETGGERKGDCVQRADHDERPQRSQRNIRERNRNDIDITRKGATIDNGERSKTIDTDGMRTVAGLS